MKMYNETKEFLKEKLSIEDDINRHLEKIPIYDAKENCENNPAVTNRYWSEYRLLHSTKGLDLEYNLIASNVSLKLHYPAFDDIVDEDKFCVNDIEPNWKRINGIAAKACM